jgi:hypothetical protein
MYFFFCLLDVRLKLLGETRKAGVKTFLFFTCHFPPLDTYLSYLYLSILTFFRHISMRELEIFERTFETQESQETFEIL